ncbi:Egl nine-like 3 [Symbiodinium microadriaticum]|uniref:Egl nine-like 3 n=1 Tax=Symbiodinium microadriaticum TaxID=2951 RepID=A0A1Q9F208_SYMMI|nr:Egl nine-like 3 [Symbiodinium microadriaticum]
MKSKRDKPKHKTHVRFFPATKVRRRDACNEALRDFCAMAQNMPRIEGRRAALEEAARQMRGRGFVLWPDFLGKDAARRLATAMRLLRGKPGRLGSVESRSLRGDLVAWPGEADSEAIRAALGDWQQAVDRLVADLRPFLPGAVELGAVDAREPVMLSCYPRGARYIRHYDNNCDTGEGDCNGRRLTVLYYLNEAASDSDGGHLRLIGQRGGVYDDRYALSCWYVDTSEAPDAPAFKMPALAESQTP